MRFILSFIVFRLLFSNIEQKYLNNKKWLPGIGKREKYNLEIPSEVESGNYLLKFKLIEQSESGIIPIQIGVKETLIDKNGFIERGKVKI